MTSTCAWRNAHPIHNPVEFFELVCEELKGKFPKDSEELSDFETARRSMVSNLAYAAPEVYWIKWDQFTRQLIGIVNMKRLTRGPEKWRSTIFDFWTTVMDFFNGYFKQCIDRDGCHVCEMDIEYD